MPLESQEKILSGEELRTFWGAQLAVKKWKKDRRVGQKSLDAERNCRNKRATIQGFQGTGAGFLGVTDEWTGLAGGLASILCPCQDGQRVAATPVGR